MRPLQAMVSTSTNVPLRPAKRPYQPDIASYLARSSDASAHATLGPRAQHSECLSPSVPEAVQVSLLNVGMRVRKAVPEGYKTTTAAAGGAAAATSAHSARAMNPRRQHLPSQPRPAELTPFCGLHKVGGYAAQQYPDSAVDKYDDDDDDDDDDNNNNATVEPVFAFSSQGSSASTVSTDSTHGRFSDKKRSIEQAYDGPLDDDDDDNDFEDAEEHERLEHARFQFQCHEGVERQQDRRRYVRATPMQQRRGHGRRRSGEMGGEPLDFGDATFLDPEVLRDEVMGGL